MTSLGSLLAAAALLLSPTPDPGTSNAWCRSLPQRVGQCREVHGRLTAYNGTPTFRIWILGTHRLLGVVGRSGHDLENEANLPANVGAAFEQNAFGTAVFADFRVCPVTRERRGVMQFVCVARAANLYVRRS